MAVLDPRRRRRSTIILLLLTSITLLSLDYQGFRPLDRVQSAIRGLVDPVAGGADSVTSPITNAWKALTDYDDLEAENERLRDQLAELEGQAISATASEDALRALLDEVDIEYAAGADTVVGQVIERPGNFESYSVEIDRGADDGIREGMPAVTAAGLVGRVTDVQDDFAQVRLLHQPDFPLGVRVIGAGEVALARGQGIGEDLLVREERTDETAIEEGDAVVTSGIEGSSFPPDLPVGVISEVDFDENRLEQSIRIRPVADLENLRYVTVIMWTVDGDDGDEP